MTNRTLRILAIALIVVCATLAIILYEWAQSEPTPDDASTPAAPAAATAPAEQ